MAGELEVGTLSGRIELEDNTSVTLANISAKVDLLGQKFDTLSGQVKRTGDAHKEAGGHVESFGASFEKLAERIVERLAIYELIKESLNITREAAEFAANFEKMSRATGIDTDSLQRLNYVTAQYGVDIDQTSRAIFTFTERLAGGDKNAVGAVQSLGLNVKELLAAGPKEAFLEFADAASKVEDPMTKNQILAEGLTARLARQLAPALGDLRQKMEDVPKEAVISEKNIQAAHDFEAGLAHLKIQTEATIVGVAGMILGTDKFDESSHKATEETIRQSQEFRALVEQTGSVDKAVDILNQRELESAKTMKSHGDATKDTTSNMDILRNKLAALQENLQPLTLQQQAYVLVLEKEGATHKEIATALGVSEDAVKKFSESQKQVTEGLHEMESVGGSWEKTLQGIDGTTVEAIKYYIEQGVSLKSLAAVYQLTEAQVKAINEAEKAEQAGRKEVIKATEELSKAENDLAKARLSIQKDALKNMLDDEEAQLQASYQKGRINQQQYLNSLISAKEDYYRRAEDLAKKQADLEVQAVADATKKELALLEEQHNQGKIDTDNYEKARTEILQAAADKRRAIEERYKQDADNRRAAEKKDIEGVANSVANVTNQVQILDHQWVTDADIAAQTLQKTTIYVKTLSGDLITLKQAMDLQDMGGSFAVSIANFQDTLQHYNFGVYANDVQPALALAKKGYSFADIVSILSTGLTDLNIIAKMPEGPGPRIPGFKEGGIGDFGSGTLAVLHGKEAIVPLENNTSYGGITNVFYVNGTAEDLARKASSLIMYQLKTQRQFPAA